MLPAGLGIAMEGADMLLQEGMGPSALPGAAVLLHVLEQWEAGQGGWLGAGTGALILWLQQFNRYVNYFFWFKRSEGCWLWPYSGEFEDQSCIFGVLHG